MSDAHRLPWADYVKTLQPHERPNLPGSPATPDHPTMRRLAYVAIGLLVTMAGTLPNAVIGANSQNLAGALGVTTNEVAWLSGVFVMTNACMNLILIKFRQQYGLQLFARIFLSSLVVISLAHVFVADFGSALLVRAVAGMSAAGLSSLGALYMLQGFPAAHRQKGLILAIGAPSLALPAARLFAPDLLQIGEWRGLSLFELGLSLLALAAVFALRLPPSEHRRVFDRLDFLTFALFAPGVALLSAVLTMGRLVWWTEAAWIGWALIGAIVLLASALIIEHNRRHPLIDTRWLSGGEIVRLALAILVVRVVLSVQTSSAGVVGLLQTVGVGPDQLYGLFWVILLATAAGALFSAFTLNMAKLNKPIAIALALIAVAAFLDSHATVLTRPANLYFSQALMAFASAMFIGPALMIGIGKVLEKGPQTLVSFIVVFSVGQNVAGLVGTALIGTVQTVREKFHSSQLAESITLSDPQVVARLQQLSGAYARTLVDPAQRSLTGLQLLGQQLTQQANVLAYNDVFLMIALIAAAAAVWVALYHFRSRLAAQRVQRAQSQAAANASGAPALT